MKSKNNFLLNPLKNILIRYKPVLLLLLLCGFNYKVFRVWNKYKIIAVIYCVSLIILSTVSTVYCCQGLNRSIQIWSLIEYILSVAILIIYDSKLTKFSVKLLKIDFMLRVTRNYYNKGQKGIFLIIIILWTVRLTFVIMYCLIYTCFTNFALFTLSLFSCFALDVNRIWRVLLLEIIRHRFRMLRQKLEENPEGYYNYYLDLSSKKNIIKDRIKLCNDLYKNILDAVELIQPEFQGSMFVSIVCALPNLIINFYHILLVLEKDEPIQSIGFVLLYTCQTCFLLFAPCIVLELQSLEMDSIKLYLINRLLVETDPKTKEDIKIFLRYTEVRSCHFTILRFIPLNICLPIEIANLCISAIIVIVNITNLYD